jgi:hypothetical protein
LKPKQGEASSPQVVDVFATIALASPGAAV